MRIQITTDYAIRIIMYLAQNTTELVMAKDAAQQLGITYNYFNKVAAKIRQAGFIETVQGPKGGYRLVKDPKDVTLYDVFLVMEGDIIINRCLESDGYCTRMGNHADKCQVHHVFEKLQNKVVHELQAITFADLQAQKSF